MKILFVYQKIQTFIQKDVDILSSVHEVRQIRFSGCGDVLRIWSGVCWADITFSWFGKLHAFFTVLFSRILGRKSIAVAGGDDVACEPQIGYGMFSYWWKKWCPLFVFRHADIILPVSEFNKEETIKNAKAKRQKVRMVYHGFSPDKFRRITEIEKENLVITIGQVSRETLAKKGLDLFIKSALFFPETKFVLVGPDIDGSLEKIRKTAPGNVKLPGGLYDEELVRLCNKAQVYVQTSIHESFGCSIAEAMLCECIPAVSRKGAIPEVVGDCGFYTDELTPAAVARAIGQALSAGPVLGKQARQRIVDNFTFERRQEALLMAVNGAIN